MSDDGYTHEVNVSVRIQLRNEELPEDHMTTVREDMTLDAAVKSLFEDMQPSDIDGDWQVDDWEVDLR